MVKVTYTCQCVIAYIKGHNKSFKATDKPEMETVV